MKTLTASEVRIPPDTFNRVAYQRERVRIDRRGAPSVAIVSIEDLELLEFLDNLSVQPAKDSLAKLKAMGEKAASWPALKRVGANPAPAQVSVVWRRRLSSG